MDSNRIIYQLYNFHIQKTERILEPENPNVTVYEVIRVIHSIPLFFDAHFTRLFNSVRLVNQKIDLDKKQLFEHLLELIRQSGNDVGNIMLKIYFFENKYDFTAFFIPHKYPDEHDYINGVNVKLLYAERVNPEAKVENMPVREKANKLINEEGVYEVLLVNSKKEITEGSRTNFVGIKDEQLFTAPLEMVLEGITLKETLLIANREGISVKFKSIAVSELDKFDAVFLTGTSPKILPVAMIEKQSFDTGNNLLKKLMERYDECVLADIKKKRDS